MGLTEITITRQEAIPLAAFNQMAQVKRLTLHDGVTSIGSYAFQNMGGLQSINSDVDGTYNLSNNLNIIGSYAFYGHSITDIYINGSIKTLQDNAFNNATISNVNYGGYSEEYFNKIIITWTISTFLTKINIKFI
jgi:hypothetical protein